jgi:hypothetical protein
MNRVEEQQLNDSSTNLGSHADDDHLDHDKGTQEDDRRSRSKELTAAEVGLAYVTLLYVMLLRHLRDLASKKRKHARTYILHLTAQFLKITSHLKI